PYAIKPPAKLVALGSSRGADRRSPLPAAGSGRGADPVADAADRLGKPIVGGGERDADMTVPALSVPDPGRDRHAGGLEEVRGKRDRVVSPGHGDPEVEGRPRHRRVQPGGTEAAHDGIPP